MVHYALNMFSNLTNKDLAVIIIFGLSILPKSSRVYSVGVTVGLNKMHLNGGEEYSP
jgi:hypothetical protein